MILGVLDNMLSVAIVMVVVKVDIEYSLFKWMYTFDFSKDIDISCDFLSEIY